MHNKNHHCHTKAENPYQLNVRLVLSLLLLSIIWVISYLPSLAKLHHSFLSYISLIWWAVLLGLLLGGMIDYFVPKAFVYKYLGQKGKKSLIYAAIAGLMLSACSHGILAIAIALYKKGASVPAVVTFLLASPWANLPTTILLFSFFGLHAIYFIVAAIAIAVTTGLILSVLESKKVIEPSLLLNNDHNYNWDRIINFNVKESLKGVCQSTISLANMILWWIILGFMIAIIIKTYTPHYLFHSYFNADFTGLILTLVIATIIEVCSEGSSPIAFEIYNQVEALGNPFVFLMAGVVTDYTEIGLLWTNIGKRTAILLPLIAVPQVLLVGYLFNLLL